MKKQLHNLLAILAGLLGSLYLLNIGAGIIELIPDNIPYVGNLDEAGAVALIFYCIQHFRKGGRDSSKKVN